MVRRSWGGRTTENGEPMTTIEKPEIGHTADGNGIRTNYLEAVDPVPRPSCSSTGPGRA